MSSLDAADQYYIHAGQEDGTPTLVEENRRTGTIPTVDQALADLLPEYTKAGDELTKFTIIKSALAEAIKLALENPYDASVRSAQQVLERTIQQHLTQFPERRKTVGRESDTNTLYLSAKSTELGILSRSNKLNLEQRKNVFAAKEAVDMALTYSRLGLRTDASISKLNDAITLLRQIPDSVDRQYLIEELSTAKEHFLHQRLHHS